MSRPSCTREQQVQAALKALTPPPEQCDHFRRRIETALKSIEIETHLARVGSKATKAALRRLQSSLWRAENAYQAVVKLDPEIANTPQQLDLKPWLTLCEERLEQRRGMSRQAHAVQWAAMLLDECCHKLSKTRTGRWARLAASLFGDPRANLYYDLRRYRPRLWRGGHIWRRPISGLK